MSDRGTNKCPYWGPLVAAHLSLDHPLEVINRVRAWTLSWPLWVFDLVVFHAHFDRPNSVTCLKTLRFVEHYQSKGERVFFFLKMVLYVASLSNKTRLHSSLAEAFANTWLCIGYWDTRRGQRAAVFGTNGEMLASFMLFFPHFVWTTGLSNQKCRSALRLCPLIVFLLWSFPAI